MPSPLYVVNQGPAYAGPGMMVPYGTYSPAAGLAAPGAYPYIGGPRYGYGSRYGYGPRFGYGPRYGYGPRFGYGVRYGYGAHYGYGRWRG